MKFDKTQFNFVGDVMNPNNCETCDYKKINEGRDGWCYMFKDEPTEMCMAHSGRKNFLDSKEIQTALDDLIISLMPRF